MKNLLLFISISVSLTNLTSCKKADVKAVALKDERPNIILILADDMGFSDLGSYGSEIHTPALDSLAAHGLRMTQFYNASRCCPTRASLLTGLYPHQANMGFMQEDCGLPGYGGYLPDNTITIAQLLKENGYNTAMSGKWHIGNDTAYWPTKKGFDKFYGMPHHGGEYFAPFISDQPLVFGNSIIQPGAGYYSTEAINDYGIRFVDEMIKDEKPFFLYLAHIAPHFPLQARKEDIAKYRGKYLQDFESIRAERFKKQKALGIIQEDFTISEADGKVPAWDGLTDAEKDDYDLRMSVYAAQIESMDRGIGELVAKLKKAGVLDNTLIVFLSDNGGTREDYSNPDLTASIGEAGSFNCYKLPWANVSNTPFRKFKHWGNEGGIRSPFIAHYPKMIKEQRIDSQPAHIIDIMTTFTELADAKYPLSFQGNSIQQGVGKSLLPIFNHEERIPHEGLFWEHEGNKAARVDNWKWVSTYPDDIDELYNLTVDPFEANNLAETNAEKLKAVKDKWQVWADKVGVIPWEKVLESKPDQARLQIWY